MEISKTSSILVVGAHPDDVKSFTGVMLRGLGMGAAVSVIGVTNGDRFISTTAEEARAMGARRKEEQVRFLAEIGVPKESIFLFGFANGCLGAIRTDYFRRKGEPYYALPMASDRVVDTGAYRPGAPFYGENLVEILKEIIARMRPTHVLTHHPKDDHDEHRATAFFVKKAFAGLERAPAAYASLVYFPRIAWPPAGESFLSPEVKKLPFAGGPIRFELTRAEQDRKRDACRIFAPTLAELLGDDYVATYMKNDELYWEI